MRRFLSAKLICLMALALSGCGDALPVFPAEYVYSVRALKGKCSRHRIISKDPITVDGGTMVPLEECEGVFGFAARDTAPVFSWMRAAQKVAKEKCSVK
jgi:hypothetical protein